MRKALNAFGPGFCSKNLLDSCLANFKNSWNPRFVGFHVGVDGSGSNYPVPQRF